MIPRSLRLEIAIASPGRRRPAFESVVKRALAEVDGKEQQGADEAQMTTAAKEKSSLAIPGTPKRMWPGQEKAKGKSTHSTGRHPQHDVGTS